WLLRMSQQIPAPGTSQQQVLAPGTMPRLDPDLMFWFAQHFPFSSGLPIQLRMPNTNEWLAFPAGLDIGRLRPHQPFPIPSRVWPAVPEYIPTPRPYHWYPAI